MPYRIALLALAALSLGAVEPAGTLHLKVPMRDGVRLCTSVFRPTAQGRYPVILLRTAYRKPDQLTRSLRVFVDHGYAVVMQDVRGRYHSEGEFQQYTQEERDGEDTLTWIARQFWSTGRVGMIGGSYNGISQWRAALSRHPALKAIAPSVAGGDEYLDRYYSRGGAFKFGHRLLWLAENFKPASWPRPDFQKILRHTPLRTADRAFTSSELGFFQDALDHPSYDGYWSGLSTRRVVDRVEAPALITTGWYDNYAEGDIDMFDALASLGRPARIIIGPWGHTLSPDMPGADFGPHAVNRTREAELWWFDAYVKQNAIPPTPGVTYFLMGQNEWKESPVWPIPAKMTSFYLSSRSGANSARGDGRLTTKPVKRSPPDSFSYDPNNPVPTIGGAVCCNPRVYPWGPLDQRPNEQRDDVLVYTSDVLKADLEVVGSIDAALYVSTSAPDTDFTAKLIDLAPDGSTRILTDGILRLRYRNGVDRPQSYLPSEVERIVIPMGVTANVFKKGHRIRLHISSSNYPRFDRNPNTGRPIADETRFQTARQTVHHDPAHPSYLRLPVRVAAPGKRPVR